MKPWDIYSYQIPGVLEPHPAVVLGHVDRVANKPQVNILLCTSQRAGRPALAHEVLLNGADGLDWETLCKCDIIHVVEKAQLNRRRGQVCIERRRQIAAKVIQGLGLAGL